MKKNSIGTFILIPIILIISLLIMDTSISYFINKKFKSNTEVIIKEVIENDSIDHNDYYSEIKKLYDKKGYNTELLYVDANSYEVNLENEINYFNIFSSIKTSTNEEGIINIFGIKFKYKKNSKAIIKVTARYNYNGEIEFTYTK